MGLDGGTKISRSDVLRGASWELSQADNSRSTRGGSACHSSVRRLEKSTARLLKWNTCALSGQPLQQPLVADFLGSLYNKEAALEFLLVRAGAVTDEEAQNRYLNQQRVSGFAFDHLQTIKDVFPVRLTETEANPRQGPAAADTTASGRFLCPTTGLPCELYPTAALSSCGHAFSCRALKEMTDQTCSMCGTAFMQLNVITLNPQQEEGEQLKGSMQEHKAAACRKRKRGEAKGAKKQQKSDSHQPSMIMSPSVDHAT